MNPSRRRYLMTAGAVAVGTAGLAGCLGGNGDTTGASETSHECDIIDRDPVDELAQPAVGSADAPVVVEVFEDFGCPGCATFATGDLSELKSDYAGDDVRFEHYDFPIPASDWSEAVGNAARSIQDAHGDEAFFEFSLASYENQSEHSWQLIGDLAEDVGADPCDVLSDAANEAYSAVLQANRDEGEARDIPGTPSVFVERTLVDRTYGDVSAAIESHL